jgi:hypothetical protein
MAKWEERDPRWLVEHRDDGKNVNGWHWEEKNKLEWSRQHINTLLTSLPAADAGSLRITQVREVTGEVGTLLRHPHNLRPACPNQLTSLLCHAAHAGLPSGVCVHPQRQQEAGHL